ncbi:hypothetical protein [Falsibacillus pallidus]|uniref:Uncharacterized protein n=1 Tax=Falsibacillus pallidus TaxID=493781 RepID=A0A370G3X3_9BACI|nr:hypothetical protein [Falsibacillus pallidus]RDI37539.1 hypothetical protein DFR59_12136 [Falsibacillus pallidus]
MSEFESISFPSQLRSDFPIKEQIEESFQKLDQSNPYYQLASFSFNEIVRFEQNQRLKKEDLLVRIHSPLPSGKVSLRSLNLVSSGIQRVFTSLYNTFFGKGNNRGMIPKEIFESSELILNATSAGSFRLHLNLKNSNPIMASHDLAALDQLTQLFDELEKREDYTDIAEEYGNRTFNILRNWFQDLDKGNVEFEYFNNKNNKAVVLNKEKIRKATQQLESIKTKEILEPLMVSGELVSASSTNNSFAIIMDNGQTLKGKTTAEAFKMGLTINKKYKFNLTKKIIENTATGEQKESYFLNSTEEF